MPTPVLDNRQLGVDVQRNNLLTNGGFERWQRGTGPFSANSAYFADRWFISLGTGSSMSITGGRIGGVPPGGSYNSMGAGISYTQGTGNSNIQQQIKASEYDLGGRYLACTAMVYGPAGGISLAMASTGTNPFNVTSGPNNGPYTNGWQKLQVVTNVPVPDDWTYFYVCLWMSITGSYYVDNVMLVLGQQPCDLAPMHPADELERCQRYYEVLSLSGSVVGGYSNAGTRCFLPVTWHTKKAGVPTSTMSAAATWSYVNVPAGYQPPSQFGANVSGTTLTVAGTTAAECYAQGNSGTAQVVAEYNP